MIQDAHTRKITKSVIAPVGRTAVIKAVPGAWIYVHELIGDLLAAGTLVLETGLTPVGTFTLGVGQGITLSDIPGEENRPRFECKPGDDFNLVVSGGTFNGAISYSLRY